MAVVQNPLIVRLFINTAKNGWSERWPIWETDWNRGLIVAAALAQARSRILSANAYLQWAVLASITPPYIEQPVITDPLMPLPQWSNDSFDMEGLWVVFWNSSGESQGHLFRAISQEQILEKQWTMPDKYLPPIPPPLPANLATASKQLLFQNTFATFRQYVSTCQPMSLGHHGAGTGYWVDPYDQVMCERASSRRVDRPYRRISWEASNYNHAPWFSPCGMVVSVSHISYSIPCRFGVGWRLRNIHYYFAKPGAAVMTNATPFYPWNRAKENTDFSGVGQAVHYRQRFWTNGLEYGNAPGLQYTGNIRDFEGFAPVPFWGTGSTPPEFRPVCDFPRFDRPIGPGGIAWGGPGATPEEGPGKQRWTGPGGLGWGGPEAIPLAG